MYEIRKKKLKEKFSKELLTAVASPTYGILCERLYGKNLCQFNMMTMIQLDRLLAILRLSKQNNVIDLGCGVGKVTEYIQDITGATITGIDIASQVVEYANEQTKEKRNRLRFQVGDMNSLDIPRKSIDTIIAIDSFKFVENIEETISKMKEIVQPKGQIGIFYSVECLTNNSLETIGPKKTKIALALEKNNLTFNTHEFTKNEFVLWKKTLEVVEEMKEEFEKEGNSEFYLMLLKEAKYKNERADAGRRRRFLYHAQI